MAKRGPRLVALGYGKFVRADRIFVLVPLDAKERGEGRRTYVHVEGLSEPLVASRSEAAIPYSVCSVSERAMAVRGASLALEGIDSTRPLARSMRSRLPSPRSTRAVASSLPSK